jgi:hypothetical protein
MLLPGYFKPEKPLKVLATLKNLRRGPSLGYEGVAVSYLSQK